MAERHNCKGIDAGEGDRTRSKGEASAAKKVEEEGWLSSWAKPAPAKEQIDEEPFVGAFARIYIRGDASSEALARIRRHLAETAQGRYALASFFEWTAIDVEREEDLLSIRAVFKPYIDGWKELS